MKLVAPTDDEAVNVLRWRQMRNFLTTLLTSQGVPMLLHGDEIGRTQQGNNNTYCQDNEISWYDWKNLDSGLLAFCQRLTHYRAVHPVFHRRRWFQGRPIYGGDVKDIAWFKLEGQPMTEEDWDMGHAKSLGVFLNGETIPNPNPKGEPRVDDSFYIILNAHHEPLEFLIPTIESRDAWMKELDTAVGWVDDEVVVEAGDLLEVAARSLVVLRCLVGQHII